MVFFSHISKVFDFFKLFSKQKTTRGLWKFEKMTMGFMDGPLHSYGSNLLGYFGYNRTVFASNDININHIWKLEKVFKFLYNFAEHHYLNFGLQKLVIEQTIVKRVQIVQIYVEIWNIGLWRFDCMMNPKPKAEE